MSPMRPELIGFYGMVSSTHWLGTATAMAVLETGGNAFDAAVAAGLVLQVAEPHLNGPGGQVVAIVSQAGGSDPRVLCGQGVAPAGATSRHFAEMGFDLIPGSGLLAATVPGAWDAWLLLLRDYGTKSLRDVLSYAIGYATRGVPVLPRIRATLDAVTDLFLADWTTSAAMWLPGGRPPVVGAMYANPRLARTWTRLLAEAEQVTGREQQLDAARRAWSQGFVAEAIDAFVRKPVRDESGDAHAGVLSGADMARWSADYEAPVTVDVGEWSLAKAGGWTQGPVFGQQLRLLEGFADKLSFADGIPSAHTVHLVTECAKLAYADREAWYGDAPGVPLEQLLSREYARQRRSLVTDEASAELRPGSINGRRPRLPSCLSDSRADQRRSIATGEPVVMPTGATRGDTVHINVVDAAGNMVAATPSGGWLQSSPAIEELGFCLDSRAQMFWLEQGLPNSLVPGRRPRTTLSPSMALRGGEPALAFGTPGGDQQDQWQLCFWLAHTVGGVDLQSAIEAPLWHSTAVPLSFTPRTWTPRGLVAESRLGEAALAELRERGHQVVDAGPWSLGGLCAVGRDTRTGVLRAAASPRGAHAYAAGR